MSPEQRRITSRQREVLDLIAEGLTDKEIAARLSISYRTVRSHVDTLLERFGTTTRTGLASRWLRRR